MARNTLGNEILNMPEEKERVGDILALRREVKFAVKAKRQANIDGLTQKYAADYNETELKRVKEEFV